MQATRIQEGDAQELTRHLQDARRESGAHFIPTRVGEVQSYYRTGFGMTVAIVVDSHRKHRGTSRAPKIQKGDT